MEHEEETRCLLPNLSDEQATILDKIEEGCCTTTRAYPGSGKTTLFEQVVLAFPTRNIIAISYNKELVKATNKLIQNSLLRNNRSLDTVCIKTYHGLLSSLVKYSVHNELLFGEALQYMNFTQLGKQWKFRRFDMLVIDESQDLRKSYLFFIIKLILYVCADRSKLSIHLLGDEKQLLYDFYPINKADARFLLHAEEILSSLFPNRPWYHAVLPISFRATPQIANVVNALVPSRHMVSGNQTSRITNWVTLYIADVYTDAAQIVYDIIKKGGVSNYGKTVILCSSLNESSVAVRIVDLLVANGIPVHVERSGALAEGIKGSNDDEKDSMQNKVCVKTFCGTKGLQAQRVIMINAIELLSEEFVNNPRYVALTRACEMCYIIQNAHYTSQAQIDTLIANPNIRQRDLRIIQKRPIKPELSKRRSQEQQGTLYSKNALSCNTLFAFIDVEHLGALLQHIDHQVIIEGLGEATNVIEVTEEEEDDEKEHVAPCSDYVADMTKSFDNGVTYVNVVNICSVALKLALEFAFSKRIPVCVMQILTKLGTDTDPKTQTMRTLIYDAINVLDSKPILGETNMHDFVLQNLTQFGSLAVVCDAFQGYREYLHAIANFGFLQESHVTMRFEMLYESMQQILEEHNILQHDLIWHYEETGRFTHGNEPVQIKVKPAITTLDRTIVVLFTNNTSTGHEDRLAAVVNGLVVSKTDDLNHTALYIMNVFDACTQRVWMREEQNNVKEEKEEKTESQSIKIEPVETKKHVRSGDEDVQNSPKRVKTEPLLERRNPCAFLNAAIGFKMWKDHEEEDVRTLEQDLEYQKEETTMFIANLQAEIQGMIEEATLLKTTTKQQIPSFEDDDF